CRTVVGVGTHAVAGELAVDARSALAGMFIFFEHEYAGTLAQHEAVAVDVPRARCRGGVIVARGKRTHGSKAPHTQRRDGGFGPAGQHDVGVAILDEPCGVADGVKARGTRRDHGIGGALEAQQDRQLARNEVDERCGHEERRNAPRATLLVLDLLFFDTRQAANAGADDGTDAVGVFFGYLEAAVAPRLDARGQTVMDEGVHGLGLFGREVFRNVEILDLTRDLGVERRRVETRDATDPGATIDEIVPRRIYIVSDWRNN